MNDAKEDKRDTKKVMKNFQNPELAENEQKIPESIWDEIEDDEIPAQREEIE